MTDCQFLSRAETCDCKECGGDHEFCLVGSGGCHVIERLPFVIFARHIERPDVVHAEFGREASDEGTTDLTREDLLALREAITRLLFPDGEPRAR